MTSRTTDDTPRGLPGPLPDGEKLLWQGAPSARAFSRHVLKIRWVAAYFALLAGGRIALAIGGGDAPGQAVASAMTLAVPAAAALGLLSLYAFAVARTTVYTLTDRRIVMRIGVALAKTINVPFTQIASASLLSLGGGAGTIALSLTGPQRPAYLAIWPHARPWQLKRAQPALRAIDNAKDIAERLAVVLRAHHAVSQAQPKQQPTLSAAAASRAA